MGSGVEKFYFPFRFTAHRQSFHFDTERPRTPDRRLVCVPAPPGVFEPAYTQEMQIANKKCFGLLVPSIVPIFLPIPRVRPCVPRVSRVCVPAPPGVFLPPVARYCNVKPVCGGLWARNVSID